MTDVCPYTLFPENVWLSGKVRWFCTKAQLQCQLMDIIVKQCADFVSSFVPHSLVPRIIVENESDSSHYIFFLTIKPINKIWFFFLSKKKSFIFPGLRSLVLKEENLPPRETEVSIECRKMIISTDQYLSLCTKSTDRGAKLLTDEIDYNHQRDICLLQHNGGKENHIWNSEHFSLCHRTNIKN